MKKSRIVALVLVLMLMVSNLSGCAWLDSQIADIKGETDW